MATSGPAVRPVWFLWEDGAFWWITGSYARLPNLLAEDSSIALVVDTRDLITLEVLQVTAHGDAEAVPFDTGTRLVRFVPGRLIAKDLSKVRP